MAHYRCYLLTSENKIGVAQYVDSDSDAAAVLKATTLLEVSDQFPAIEVWKGGRIVGRIPRQDLTLDLSSAVIRSAKREH
jgi:hypothetical protein